MISDRMAKVLLLLQNQEEPGEVADIAAAAAGALGVDGLALSLTTADEDHHSEVWWSSQGPACDFEDLQLTLGQGPGIDTASTGAMVWVPDLAAVRADRWPLLSMEAPDLAARAVFCFPLGIGAIRVGVLTAVRRTPGPLTPEQADDALVLAAALTARCLGQGEPGQNALDPTDPLRTLPHAVVHQATGMLSVQLSLPLPQALLRLRAHAYSSGRTINATSQDIVDRRLRLDHNGDGDGTAVPVADKD
ncbi:ANTAR domain-containing protein [Streptomyces sp. SID13666]|uniref:ANTAR domain-containing protein n=1 Tax=unclassified Streptomyces TaxID=2593676 RepID=UPI0013BF81DD|nr:MULTISPECIES: ANTAR domain-containing protein [unclassified Streptomyces]MCZ4098935.1 ANTAR domain-containing protein [Streptomyces sp. H39-C1]NEA60126.1 ANTAR domain-containing protein [Streptomyces sp. SID13666]